MKVVVYGASGKTGSRVVKELIARGHSVIAVSRNATKAPAMTGVSAKDDDLSDVNKIAAIIKGSDAVVSAYAPPAGDTDQAVGVHERLVKAIEKNSGPRLLVVGGAGSLFVAPGVTLRDSGHLPPEWLPIVDSHIKVLEDLRKSRIDWTYFSPAAFFEPGERTGKFRLGQDDLIFDTEAGKSHVSMDDYAIAVVDELERPQHRGLRFTIGY